MDLVVADSFGDDVVWYENDGSAGGWARHGSLDGASAIGANGGKDGHRVATDLPGTSWIDGSILPDRTYYYLVRAEDGTTGGGGSKSGGGGGGASSSICSSATTAVSPTISSVEPSDFSYLPTTSDVCRPKHLAYDPLLLR